MWYGRIREQNVRGGRRPARCAGLDPSVGSGAGTPNFQLAINTKGRLSSEEDFRNIIIKTGELGQITRLRDVARVELGSDNYALRAMLDNKPAAAIPIFQRPGSNAIEISKSVRAKMEELKKRFPARASTTTSSTTRPCSCAARSSAVVHTLLEAIAAGRDRRDRVPADLARLDHPADRGAGVPDRHLRGDEAASASRLNALSLFGLVLAIGIVVDDAIVVVENVERNIARAWRRWRPRARRCAKSPARSSPPRWCCVRCSCPTAFISGLTGEFYKQFALTIAISTVISAFNSLTLSPALSALSAEAPRCAARPPHARPQSRPRLAVPALQPLVCARFAAATCAAWGGSCAPAASRCSSTLA